jgi:hypothetical protein
LIIGVNIRTPLRHLRRVKILSATCRKQSAHYKTLDLLIDLTQYPARTDPHMVAGGFPITNPVLMIAFADESALARLIGAITEANAKIKRSDDKIRMFQVPLKRIV